MEELRHDRDGDAAAELHGAGTAQGAIAVADGDPVDGVIAESLGEILLYGDRLLVGQVSRGCAFRFNIGVAANDDGRVWIPRDIGQDTVK